jgi:addiction module RelE/StbE family toxin
MNQEYEVIWSNRASKDLEHIIKYIANGSPFNALQTLKIIREKAASLYILPERGRIIPELQAQNIRQYRELIIPPWRVVYRISEKSVYVLSVLDSRQNIEDILLQRLVDS